MVPLRYRSTGPVTRINQPASKISTRQNLRRPKGPTNQDSEISQNELRDETDFEPDLNELFIQSIEELLPEREQIEGASTTPAPHSSSERSPVTPNTHIKVERISDSLTNIYDTSPRDPIYKAAGLGKRQASRSTAQLTTPGSSPKRKRVRRNSVEGGAMIKSEVNHESDGRQCFFNSIYSPPVSSPEEINLPNRPGSRRLPTALESSPWGAIQAPANNLDMCQSSSRAEGRLDSAILLQGSTVRGYNGPQRVTVSNQQPYALTSKVSKSQKYFEKPARYGSLGGKSPTAYPPILPSPEIRPIMSKITPTSPTGNVFAQSSTLEEFLPIRDNTTRGKLCRKLTCLGYSPKDVVEECGYGRPEKHSYIPRVKSLSACPSSVSSFGPDEDIPLSGKMHCEVGRAITESAKTLASGRISELSPSLRYSDLLARLGISHHAPKDKGEVNDIYDDFDEECLPQKNPCREIFGKPKKNATDHSRTDSTLTTQRSYSVEEDGGRGNKRLQRIHSRRLRSFSAANDLSKKSENLDQEIGYRDENDSENEPFHGSIDCVTRGTDEDSSSECYERASQRASTQVPTQALLKVKSSGPRLKRAREVIDDWQPRFSDDEDMADEDDIVEINRSVFEISENRRKKRHKSKSDKPNRESTPASPAPKEESVEGNENFSPVSKDSRTAEISCNDNAGNAEQEKTLCDYYMNTYWDHGRASDGRRARDGFISYVDFKEYCRKNRQPTDDRCMLTYKKDLKHHLRCAHHASLRQDLFRVAWNFDHNPGFSFKSCSRDEETRRLQNEAIGNAPSPGGSSRGSAAVADGQVAEMIAEVLKVIGTSHTADVAQLTKSKKKLESEVRGLKRHLARVQKR